MTHILSDPESHFPWIFYFNGEQMPRWGACWMSCDLITLAIDEKEKSGEVELAQRLFRLFS